MRVPSLLVLYGDHDWLYYADAARDADRWRRQSPHLQHVEMHIIPEAGHHLYLDNSRYFNEVMRQYHRHVYRQTTES